MTRKRAMGCTRSDGDRYEGEWKGNLREGKRMFTSADESTYTGDFVKDKREGQRVY